MAYNDVTLSEEQLEKLNDGESVSVNKTRGGLDKINPPCGDEHDWSRYDVQRLSNGEGYALTRRCKNCGESEVVEDVDLDSHFGE